MSEQTMSEEKQIEEMEQLVRSVIYQENDKGFANGFDALCTATEYLTEKITEALYNAGFRKQSENVIELPCKAGDTVYIIEEVWDETVDPYVLDVKVLQFFINKHGIAVDLELPLGMRLNTWMVVGKNVFLTEEEAEQALAKMKGGE